VGVQVAAVVRMMKSGDSVGDTHADPGVDADPAQFLRRLFRRAFQRLGVGTLLDLLHLLCGLPEEGRG